MVSKDLRVAIKAVKEGGRVLKNNFHRIKKIRHKSRRDYVTNVDVQAEKKIISVIKKNFPKHNIKAEETGKQKHKSDYTWFVDPLDGTTNFIKSIPFFCSAAALKKKNEVLAGAVYNPITDELFFAEKGKGAYLNNERIKVNNVDKISKAFIFYCNKGHDADVKQIIKDFKKIKYKVVDMRKLGSGDLELCHVASGDADAFFSRGTDPWDVIPGSIILQEAGGKVTGIDGKPWEKSTKNILGTNGKIHKQLMRLLKK